MSGGQDFDEELDGEKGWRIWNPFSPDSHGKPAYGTIDYEEVTKEAAREHLEEYGYGTAHITWKEDDMIEAPPHYVLFDDLEAIEAIEKLLTPEQYEGYLRGCELKYRFRAGKKDNLEQDIHKSLQYAKYRNEL